MMFSQQLEVEVLRVIHPQTKGETDMVHLHNEKLVRGNSGKERNSGSCDNMDEP